MQIDILIRPMLQMITQGMKNLKLEKIFLNFVKMEMRYQIEKLSGKKLIKELYFNDTLIIVVRVKIFN